ncbi:MAG: HlyC/CorC family transporter [Lachnospiraceae bacterium]|nr:HlyC/CorC family transporter [Lachnospiraceae bacterium]
MTIDIAIQIVLLILLLALSFFFSSAETALTTVSRIKILTLADEGDRRARRVLDVIDDKGKMLSAILIGNNIVNISSSSLATVLAVGLLGHYGAGIATGILTFLILVFGEISPKNLATVEATKLSLRYAGIIWFLMWLLTPCIIFINAIAWFFLHRLGVSETSNENLISAKELETIVDVGHESGAIEDDEKDLIHNVFDFSNTTVKEVMIPRIDMTIANVNWSYDKLMSVYSKNMYTRIPVYEGENDNIIGLINMKDILLIDRKQSFSMREHLRKPFFTYERKKTSDLFDEMRQNSLSIAIVLDEFGAMVGMVTLEDLLEELVGEIRDEFDTYETDNIVGIGEREFEVLGGTNLEDLMDEIPLGFESEDYDTIGGYLTGLFDHFPAAGEKYVTENGAILTVAEVKRHRIEKVRIRLPQTDEAVN